MGLASYLDAALVCGSVQQCAALQTGIEGVIHSMNQVFSTHQDQGTGCGVLLVDAANVASHLKHASMLMHVRVLWLYFACFFNTYGGLSVLVLRGPSTYFIKQERYDTA